MNPEAEFLVDEEPVAVRVDFRQVILAAIGREAELRRALIAEKVHQETETRQEEEFLRRLITVKEKRCEQFVKVERKRQAEVAFDAQSPLAREEAEKWLSRLERLQIEIDSVLEKHGVTRYEPSGHALPERDDIKESTTVSGLDSGTIAQVLRPGYLWRGQVLRPAEVIIAE